MITSIGLPRRRATVSSSALEAYASFCRTSNRRRHLRAGSQTSACGQTAAVSRDVRSAQLSGKPRLGLVLPWSGGAPGDGGVRPFRSRRFGRALAEAHRGAGECSEAEPGRYRARFVWARTRPPTPRRVQNSVIRSDGLHAAASYSLMRPPSSSCLWMCLIAAQPGAEVGSSGGWSESDRCGLCRL